MTDGTGSGSADRPDGRGGRKQWRWQWLVLAAAVAVTIFVGVELRYGPWGRAWQPATPPAAVVELFANDRDPATAAWLQTLQQEWQQAFPGAVTVRVLNPDDEIHYARLTALETAAGLKEFGEVEMFVYCATPDATGAVVFPAPAELHPLPLVGREAIAARGQAALRALLSPQKGLLSGDHPDALKAAAHRLLAAADGSLSLPADFPQTTAGPLNPQSQGVVARWTLRQPAGEKPVPAELALLYLPVDCPVCADTELLVLTVAGVIRGVESLRPIEEYGEPIPAEAAKFLAQFQNLSLDGSLPKRLAQIDGISGATKSVTNVKALLRDLDERVNAEKTQP